MSKYTPHVYCIRTLTNLHVGGGETGYDYVDKQVQRDPTDGLPMIHSSGLKGALRDHFNFHKSPVESEIFGSDVSDTIAKQGKYRFLSGHLLMLPQPDDNQLFKMAYCDEVKNAISEKIELLGERGVTLPLKGSSMDVDQFKELATDLPVIARNYLKNGISENLWHEQVVPRESYFIFMVLAPDGHPDLAAFDKLIDGQVIQVGGNATIGYGLCLFKKIKKKQTP